MIFEGIIIVFCPFEAYYVIWSKNLWITHVFISLMPLDHTNYGYFENVLSLSCCFLPIGILHFCLEILPQRNFFYIIPIFLKNFQRFQSFNNDLYYFELNHFFITHTCARTHAHTQESYWKMVGFNFLKNGYHVQISWHNKKLFSFCMSML